MSINQQIEELKAFVGREKLEIVKFLTEAETAKIPGRPVFNNLVKLIERGFANGIVSWNPDRLARNTIDGGKIVYLLDTGKPQSLKFPTHWFENTPQGRLMLNIAFGQKLDKLLDIFLDETVDTQSYQRKKQKFLENQQLLKEKIEEIQKRGSV